MNSLGHIPPDIQNEVVNGHCILANKVRRCQMTCLLHIVYTRQLYHQLRYDITAYRQNIINWQELTRLSKVLAMICFV